MKAVASLRKKVSRLFDQLNPEPSGPPSGDDQWAIHDIENPLRAELYSPAQLERHADSLSTQHSLSFGRRKELLLPRLKKNEKIIDQTYELVTKMVREKARMPPAAEWLLDNYYVIKEHIGLASEHLPRRFSRELPVLTTGPAHGLPRIYHLATELISHVDGRVDIGNLSSFIDGYQHTMSLTVGELWAVPIMLRLALIENLRRVAQRIRLAHADCDLATDWSNKLVAMAARDPKNLVLVLADMLKAELPSSCSFIAELCRNLQGQNSALALALSWFDQHLAEQGLSVEQVIFAESQGQAADQVSIGNTITSLRQLSAADWRKFVERHSAMEEVLRKDPSGVYPLMNFETRDAYRQVVDKIAKRAKRVETDVARDVIDLAKRETDLTKRTAHVGYYLVDRGLEELEKKCHCSIHSKRPSTHSGQFGTLFAYLFGLFLLTALMTVPVVYLLLMAHVAHAWVAVLSVLFAIGASQSAMPICNALATKFVAPQRLPQLDFIHGIPDECRSVVAVATLLDSKKTADSLIDGLEIRYLSNRDKNLSFALLTDFPDADVELKPGDMEVLGYAKEGVRTLNAKYSSDRLGIFYLLHRPRRWNPGEQKWMGYERKRGKLAEFNAVLRNKGMDRFMDLEGNLEALMGARYVIPLDTDTQLPQNSARQLASAMAHVLNRPIYDEKLGRVVAGYGILQPRVTLNLSNSRRSWFVSIFARDAGVDPYTRAVSDVYQDLFGEGSFVGKGIYDVDMFEHACSHFPENRILSHDLIEGTYARAGLLSDVELFEDYPARFNADAKRRHRWMRGDWQIARWLLPIPPCVK